MMTQFNQAMASLILVFLCGLVALVVVRHIFLGDHYK